MNLLKKIFCSAPNQKLYLCGGNHPSAEMLEGYKKFDSIDKLAEGNEVIMSVGTWCCGHPNNDWRWVRGYVQSVTPTETICEHDNERVNYNIIKLSPVQTEEERKRNQEILVIDVNQPYHNPHPPISPVTWGMVYKKIVDSD